MYFPQGQGLNENFTILCDDYDGKNHQIDVNGVVFTTLPPRIFEYIDKNPDIQRCLPEHWRTCIVKGSAGSLSVPISSAKNAVSDGIACLGGHVFGALLINGGLYTKSMGSRISGKSN